jgi:hypothetical protein
MFARPRRNYQKKIGSNQPTFTVKRGFKKKLENSKMLQKF